MDPNFSDRALLCADCHAEFIFTAGEQLFFFEKQFKNDPKRCKPCKSRRSGLAAVANGTSPVAAGIARTETRTECSDCGVETTVPFKPTQGRPVLCRACFQMKSRAAQIPVQTPLQMMALLPEAQIVKAQIVEAQTVEVQILAALTEASVNSDGAVLSSHAAVLAAASMAAASPQSSVATAKDLASISPDPFDGIPLDLIPDPDTASLEQLAAEAAEA